MTISINGSHVVFILMFCLICVPLSLHSVPANFSPTTIHEDQNNTNGPWYFYDEYEEWTPNLDLVYSLIILVLGIPLNVFVLMVFCLHKKACTVPEIYMSNLAAADLVRVSCFPFWAAYVRNKFNGLFGSFFCKLVPVSNSMTAYCSIYFLVLVSLDRYMALVHPLTLERLRRPKYAKLSCVVVWGVGLLLTVPLFIFRKVYYFYETNTTICYLNLSMTHKLLFDTMVIIFSFIIPISIIFYCTFKIIQALNNRVMHGLNTQKMEQKAITLVLVVVFAFLICLVPLHLVRIIKLFKYAQILGGCSLRQFLRKYFWIFSYFALINSVLNPILYVIIGKNFRNKVKELFKQ